MGGSIPPTPLVWFLTFVGDTTMEQVYIVPFRLKDGTIKAMRVVERNYDAARHLVRSLMLRDNPNYAHVITYPIAIPEKDIIN